MSQATSELKTIETLLEKAIEALWKASLTVTETQSSSSELLPKRMQEFMETLSQLEASARRLDPSISIPLKVVEDVDMGRNPDLYLYELGKAVVTHSDELRGAAYYATNLKHLLQATLPPPPQLPSNKDSSSSDNGNANANGRTEG